MPGRINLRAKGRPKSAKRGGMNRTETEFAAVLEEWRIAGVIVWWRYEPFTLRVTDGFDGNHASVRYTTDFAVMLPDGEIELYEVKGFADEKDILRMKAAADVFPFTFRLVKKLAKKDGGGWSIEPV